MDISLLLETAKSAAQIASKAILEIYNSGDFAVQHKADDSPLTRADKAAHLAILRILEPLGLPILSEEGRAIPYEERKHWDFFWMVDPLDGTKEFIKRNGEFTVNIALIHEHRPVLGAVMVPVTGDLYWASQGKGAFKNGAVITSNSFSLEDERLRVVASRSHMNADTEAYLSTLSSPQIVSKGSSLKLLMVAEGEADLYPRYAPTMEWDTAAADIIVVESGGQVLLAKSAEPLAYNKQNLLNPFFEVLGNS